MASLNAISYRLQVMWEILSFFQILNFYELRTADSSLVLITLLGLVLC